MRKNWALFITFATAFTIAGSASAPALGGIQIGGTIVTPVDDPHLNVHFDFRLQANTLLTFGDSITVGAVPYIDPNTGANLQYIITPFLGPWAGRFVGSVLPSPNRNYFKYTYVDTTPFFNNTGGPIDISTDAIGLGFGFFTVDIGPITPEIVALATQTLSYTSITTDPNDTSQKIIETGFTTPVFVPEPSTLIIALALVPTGIFLARRRRSA